MQTVAVSGASGLIGGALCAALAESGLTVRRLRRGATASGTDVAWDPVAGTIDAEALEGVDAVVHLAGEGIGEKKWSEEQKRKILESRTKGTGLLAGALAALDHKPDVFVSASAIGYYGNRGAEELTEESPAGSDFLAEVCTQWEAAAAPAAAAGIRTVLVRTGIVLSPAGGALKRMVTPFKLGVGGRIGSGEQYMSWISLGDEVRAVEHILQEASLSGPVNLTAPHPVTNAEFTKTLGAVLGRPTVLPTPLFPLKAVYGAELVEHLLLDSQRVLPARLLASGFEFRHPTLEAALRAVLGRPAA